ncbi:hypothetical protein H9Q72_012477 [Fusarium xylarioides]|uniref:Ankyrin n=1 Tax=Fusarium xylarioides TaxID=221167 RepID=A0A9P7L0H0_9HYPO|nr:hypothetical protein H9Q72_012477 [Fusarium xylarioides]
MVASFGILLQLGVLIYFGFITYYPTLKFKKDDKRVLGYAFPFAAGGTLVLVLGMLLCAHVVDRSTTEVGYGPAPGREMRMIWLQQQQIVVITSQRGTSNKPNDESKSQSSTDSLLDDVHSTSGQSDDKEETSSPSDLDSGPALNLTVVATGVCLAGFIIQFIGLRAMHWSASVGQLIAVIIMTILRASVRLGFLAPINWLELRDRFELDGLALALGDPKLDPGSGPMGEVNRFDFGLSKGRTWTVVLKGDGGSESGADSDLLRDGNAATPAEADSPDGSNLLVERRDNEAQETLDIRKHLARLAGWRGPASKEANSLVEAIEVTMNTLCPWVATDSPTWTWTIQVDAHAKDGNSKHFPVSLHLKYNPEQKSWKARIDELDSVLSLWLASIDKGRELDSSTAETTQIEDDDEWFRKRSSQTRGGLILLGEHTQALKQAFDWWLPADAPEPEEIKESQIRERYCEAWRVVGTRFCEGHYKSPLTEYSDEEEENGQTDSDESDEFGNEDDDMATILCIQSNDVLERLFARHIFHAFLWTAVSKMEAPIDRHSEMEAVGTIILGKWNNIRLRGTGLARLAGAIRSSGLMDLNHAYLTLIPPLHAYERLGELDCVIETLLRQALQYEKILNWKAAYESYNAMLDLASQFREDSFTFRRTVAIVVEYMRTITRLPRIPENKLSLRLSHSAYQQIQNDLKILYERHQCGSVTSTYNDRRQFEINCGFTQLHELIARPDSEDWLEIRAIERRDAQSGSLTKSQVTFGEIPEELQAHVKIQDILGWTPLHYVVAWRDNEAPYWIESLLSKGADIDATDIQGWTPLHYSIWNRNHRAFDKLLEKGANVKVAGVDGTTPLHIAAAKLGAFAVDQLITHPMQRGDQFAADNLGRIPIHLAAQKGNEYVIGSLRLSINGKDHQGRTALHLATFGGHLGTLSKLIECGANLDVTYEPSDSVGSYTAFQWATRQSKAEVVKIFLGSGADVDARSHGRCTPLHYACEENNLKIVDILIEHGADVNAENRFHETPLWCASSRGNPLCVGRLLKAPDIDINAWSGSGDDSPLLVAIQHGHGDIVRMLVEEGAIISQSMVEVAAMCLNASREHQTEDEDGDEVEEGDKEEDEEGQVGDRAEDEEEAEDAEGMQEAEHKKRPGLKTKDVAEYIHAAFSLRNAFEEHVHGEMGIIVLSELIRRLCPS